MESGSSGSKQEAEEQSRDPLRQQETTSEENTWAQVGTVQS